MIRLVAVDIDGTLLDSRGKIPAANVEALHRVVAQGVRVVIATGRSFSFALQAIGPLPEEITLVVHNGAITRTRAGDTLVRRLLPRAVAHQVLEATMSWRSEAVAIFDRPLEGQMVSDRMDWTHPHRRRFKEKNLAVIQEVPRLEDAVTEDPIQIGFNGGVDAMRAIVDHLNAHAVAPHVEVALTEYRQRDFSMVDVSAAGTSKGSGLAAVASWYGVGQSEVMAVGDNHNDRDMLAWAGTGVVMGNAEPELHVAGLYVTGTNDEAGLAQAIDRFVPRFS